MSLRAIKVDQDEPDEVEQILVKLIAPIVKRLVAEEIERQNGALRWDWMDPEQAADLLGITPDAVRHRAKRGQIPSKTIGRRVYIDMREFDRQLREEP